MIKNLNQYHLVNQTFSFECNIVTPTLPNNYFENIWSQVVDFLNSIYGRGQEIEVSYSDLYNNIENCCMHGFDEKIKDELSSYYKKLISVELEAIKMKPKNQLLTEFDALWRLLFNQKRLLTEIMIYFERTYLLKKTRIKTLEKLILAELAALINNLKEIKDAIIQQVIDQIMRERKGETIDKDVIRNVVQMLIKIELYKPFFEPELLRVSDQFYKDEAAELNANFEVVGYLKHTERRINEEIGRTMDYLDKSTENKLCSLIEKIFITDNLQAILSNGFDGLIDNSNIESLSKLYYFLDKVGKLDFLKKTWGYYIKQRGNALINENELSVERILQYKASLETILNDCFQKNASLKSAMQFAFEDCINVKTNKIAELSSKYIDDVLKNAHKISNDEQAVEAKLDDAISIFRYLSAKDIFEAFYTKRLVKRLLLGLSSSDVLEKKMIDKLKHECGTTFTRKSEDIFKDFEISKGLTSEFLGSNYYANIDSKIEFSVVMFSMNSWPLKNLAYSGFSSPFSSVIEAFNKFYLQKFAGVVISWQYDTSTCEVTWHAADTKYQCIVSVIQAIILLLFNNKEELTFDEIKEIINIDPEDLKTNLMSFLIAKERIIKKEPETSTKISETDKFSINTEFTSKRKQFKINPLQKKETKEEIDQTTNRVLQERQYLLDAAIVRVMKQKKTIAHNDLVNQVFDDLKLPISISEMKKRIESLIERDYMMRDKENLQMYHYLA